MNADRMIDCLDQEFGKLAAAIRTADPDAGVPSCPDWTAADLALHVTHVYLHKAETMRRGDWPEPWPPADAGTLEAAFVDLRSELATRPAADAAVTWLPTDQTVGFWLRRMLHETVIHRMDAELAAGVEVSPVADDVAQDGVDEALRSFLEFEYPRWPDYFGPVGDLPEPVAVRAGERSWTVAPGVVVTDGAGHAGAAVEGAPTDVLRWLWGRGGDPVVAGESAAHLRRLLAVAM